MEITKKDTAHRKPISKRVRFEIFKRDGFRCAYCGATPPAVILHVDHINPVSNGGGNSADNLITSCEACNLGKSDKLLSSTPEPIAQRAKELKERELQLREYTELLISIKRREDDDIESIADVFGSELGASLTDGFKRNIRQAFLGKLDVETLRQNAELACLKRPDDPEQAAKYFCGINWRMIKGQ